jgi:hypothetical protein
MRNLRNMRIFSSQSASSAALGNEMRNLRNISNLLTLGFLILSFCSNSSVCPSTAVEDAHVAQVARREGLGPS